MAAEADRPPPEPTPHGLAATGALPWLGLAAVVAAIIAFNIVNNRVAPRADALTAPLELAALAGLAWVCGLGLVEVGLARSTWARGLRWAAGSALVVGVVFGIAIALPVTRAGFLDRRADLALGLPLIQAVVATAIATAVLEEFAFRGVLWGLVNRLRGPVYATVISSVLFGLWHILPSLRLNRNNEAVGSLFGRGPGIVPAVVVLGAVATVLAGVVLCELRRRSGSLLAPLGMHLATNCLGYVFSAVVWAIT
jgi:membrane protease YdiL (CAAX protease family)